METCRVFGGTWPLCVHLLLPHRRTIKKNECTRSNQHNKWSTSSDSTLSSRTRSNRKRITAQIPLVDKRTFNILRMYFQEFFVTLNHFTKYLFRYCIGTPPSKRTFQSTLHKTENTQTTTHQPTNLLKSLLLCTSKASTKLFSHPSNKQPLILNSCSKTTTFPKFFQKNNKKKPFPHQLLHKY